MPDLISDQNLCNISVQRDIGILLHQRLYKRYINSNAYILDLVAAQLKTIECNGTSLLLSWNASSLLREGLTGEISVGSIATLQKTHKLSEILLNIRKSQLLPSSMTLG